MKRQLALLLAASTKDEYAESLTQLGESLGAQVRRRIDPASKPFAIISTPEDADFLVTGMLSSLGRDRARLVCYWTARQSFEGEDDVATVTQRYEDPRLGRTIDSVVIAKSIISSSCVVRTNLDQFLQRLSPRRIVIAAPVMLAGADKRLRAAFSPDVANKFEFVTFATDSKREGGIVVPGVGGMVEQRLGMDERPARAVPKLVASWQRDHAPANGRVAQAGR